MREECRGEGRDHHFGRRGTSEKGAMSDNKEKRNTGALIVIKVRKDALDEEKIHRKSRRFMGWREELLQEVEIHVR